MANHIYNLQQDTEDMRDIVYSAAIKSAAHLPTSIDLRPNMPPVMDQGSLGQCTGMAAIGMKGYWMKVAGKNPTLSSLYVYWRERQMEDRINEDSGATIRSSVKVLQKWGVCDVRKYVTDITKFTTTPTREADLDAAGHKIVSYKRILTLDYLRASLAEKHPVIMGMFVYPSMEDDEVTKTGMVPMPSSGERPLGGHAVLAVGYDDDRRLVTVRNSWGVNWGDKGYFYLPYDYWRGFRYMMDMWTGK